MPDHEIGEADGHPLVGFVVDAIKYVADSLGNIRPHVTASKRHRREAFPAVFVFRNAPSGAFFPPRLPEMRPRRILRILGGSFPPRAARLP
jgi:hypothetical protein